MSLNNESLGTFVRTMHAGLLTALPAGTLSLTVGARTWTVQDLAAKVAEFENYFAAADDAHAAWRASIVARDGIAADARAFLTELKPAIVALFGTRSVELEKFGIKPKKERRRSSVEEKAAAVERRRATREARHTLGRRQKADIKGADATGSDGAAPPAKGAGTPP